MPRSHHRTVTTALAVCASLVLAACGGGEDGSGEAQGTETTTSVGQESSADQGSARPEDPSAAPTTGESGDDADEPTGPTAPAPVPDPTQTAPTQPAPTTPGDPSPSATSTPPGDPSSEPTVPPSSPSEPTAPPSPPGEPSEPPSSPAPDAWSDWVSYGPAGEQVYSLLPGQPGKGLVVMVHGGGWVGGKADAFRDESSRKNTLVRHLHEQGWWVATVEYRKADESPWPATAQDVHAGVTRAVADARGQGAGQRTALFGDSAGGQLAALEAVTHPGTVDAVVGYYGIYDPLTAKTARAAKNCPPKTAAEDHILMHDATDPAVRDRIEKTASPVALATAAAPPMMFLHGTKDCVAPSEQSVAMAAALQAKGVEASTIIVPGADHSQPVFWTAPEHLGNLTRFLTTQGF
ncbi:alpha/beta hydrolase [Kytococcus sedentarius]|uniref:alpha/beta hydrolase n=1 Tax=Kytococcus sedentarius TaxID=1276 RepID=UPI00194DC586|nr:alpha/beta hydrolase [Kytococcus sedentarius]QRO87357.1 alpha/beta hydrolase fold domain-containing protein [Kytococcus sedentarius]